MKVKGKAAIDVVCNPLGKSRDSFIQQFMILTFGSLANSTPYLGGILLVIVLAWLAVARSLDSQFSRLAKGDLQREKVSKGAVKKPEVVMSAETSDGPFGLQASEETSKGSTLPNDNSSNGTAVSFNTTADGSLKKNPDSLVDVSLVLSL